MAGGLVRCLPRHPATAVVMAGTSQPEPFFVTIDRRFLFALRDVPTGAVLFFGRVTDPTTTD